MEHKKRGETLKVEVIKAQENNKNLANPRKIERMRVAAYCRVSTDDEDQIKSYDSMVRYYTDMIKNNKDWVYAGVYADKAMTGTKDNREQFQKLIQDCKDGNAVPYKITFIYKTGFKDGFDNAKKQFGKRKTAKDAMEKLGASVDKMCSNVSDKLEALYSESSLNTWSSKKNNR